MNTSATATAAPVSLCVAAKGTCDATPFLRALQAQGFQVDAASAVNVAYDGEMAGAADLVAAGWVLHRLPQRTSTLRLWGHAIAAATHDNVAVLDIQCPPGAGWWQGVQRGLRAGSRMFAGPVVPGFRPEQAAIVGYMVDYAQFHPPFHADVREVPGINFVCSRALLDPPSTLVERGFFKTFTLWRLARTNNVATERRDDMQVIYERPLQMRAFLTRRYRHGRCFAGCRHAEAGQPPRVACIAFAPLLPLLRCWRILRAARRHSVLHRAFWRQLPRIALSECAWSWGELAGYLLGPGTACRDLD